MLTASVLVEKVRKPPYVAVAHLIAEDGEQKLNLVSPLTAGLDLGPRKNLDLEFADPRGSHRVGRILRWYQGALGRRVGR
jgi:hypothetical protein